MPPTRRPSLVRALAHVVERVIVDPVREGLPRTVGWPAGLAPVALVGMLGCLLCGALVLGSGWIRRADMPVVIEGQQVIGSWTITLLLWLVVLVTALGLTAVLHVHSVLRVLGLVMLLAPLLPAAAISLRLERSSGWIGLGAIIAIVLFALVRGWSRFAWFEFPVLLVLSTTAVFVSLGRGVELGYDSRTQVLTTLLVTLTSLALPSLMVTGYAAAQVSVSLSEWCADRLNRALGQRVVIALALVLSVVVLASGLMRTLRRVPGWSWQMWAASAVMVGLALTASNALLRLRPERGLYSVPPNALDNAFTPLVYPLSMLVVPHAVGSVLAAEARALAELMGRSDVDWIEAIVRWTQSDLLVALLRLLSAAGALWLAVRRARCNDRISPVLLVCYALVLGASTLRPLTAGRFVLAWTADGAATCLVVVVLVTTAWLWAREGHRQVTWKQVLLVALLACLFRFREPLSEPAMVLAGVSGTAVVLLSLLWRILTDGTLARGHSRALPQPSRVLLFATSCLLTGVVLAWSAQTRIEGLVDHTPFTELGDHMLGKPLMLAAGVCSSMAILGRLQDDEPGLGRS